VLYSFSDIFVFFVLSGWLAASFLVGLRRKHKIVCDVFIVIGMFGIVMLIFV
jgi:hypothetical protein